MNIYLHAQITNMKALVRTFNQSCIMSARSEKGTVNKSDEKAIQKIEKATNKFLKELEKITEC